MLPPSLVGSATKRMSMKKSKKTDGGDDSLEGEDLGDEESAT
jgi:hypothetical protein